MTHTVAVLEVSPETFADVKARIERVNQNGDYNHMFDTFSGQPAINMHEIAIVVARNMTDPEKLMLTSGYQAAIDAWMMECFGPAIMWDKVERADRAGEEMLELMQCVYQDAGADFASRAHALVDYVAGRPVGEVHQEIGGVAVTLAALANTYSMNIGTCANLELTRITQPEMILKIRAKQQSKPTGSALPIPVAPSYKGFFYQLADAMDIPAQAKSPRAVWEDEMLPRLRSLLAGYKGGPSPKHALDNIIRGAKERGAVGVSLSLEALELLAADDGENHEITVDYQHAADETDPIVVGDLAADIKADLTDAQYRQLPTYRTALPYNPAPVIQLHNSDRDRFTFTNDDAAPTWYVLTREAGYDIRKRVDTTVYLKAGSFPTFGDAVEAYSKAEYYDGIEWFIVHGRLEPQ